MVQGRFATVPNFPFHGEHMSENQEQQVRQTYCPAAGPGDENLYVKALLTNNAQDALMLTASVFSKTRDEEGGLPLSATSGKHCHDAREYTASCQRSCPGASVVRSTLWLPHGSGDSSLA